MSDAETAALREPWIRYTEQRDVARFGMWIFIVSEVLFFGAFFLAFTYLRILHTEAFETASSRTGLAYGATNTVLLLTSSFTMSLAVRGSALGRHQLTTVLLGITAALGSAFLVVKGFEYRDDLDKGLWPGPSFPIKVAAAQLFFSAYWIITIIHVIHLTIGIGVIARLAQAIGRRRLPLVSPQLEIAALYWSFVDIVWVMLFPIIYLGGGA